MFKTKFDDVRRVIEAKSNELLNGTSDRDEIQIENATEEFDHLQQLNREVAIRNLDRESRLLKEVQAANRRLEEDTFACACGAKKRSSRSA